MKKINVTFFVLFIGLSGFAQYKKASYFHKDGRNYGFGTRFYAMGNGIGTRMGYTFSVGKDTEGKQFFSGYEFQYIPHYNFEFGTTNRNGVKVTTSGITKGQFVCQINFGWYVLKNESAEQKIKPYVTGAIIAKLLGGIKKTNSDYDDAMVVSNQQFSYGVGAGAGCIFNLNSWLGLKVGGGYAYTFSFSTEADNKDVYNVFPKHAYVSAGFHFRIVNK